MRMMITRTNRATAISRVRATCRVPLGLIPVMAAKTAMMSARPSHANQLMTDDRLLREPACRYLQFEPGTADGVLGDCRGGLRVSRSPLRIDDLDIRRRALAKRDVRDPHDLVGLLSRQPGMDERALGGADRFPGRSKF